MSRAWVPSPEVVEAANSTRFARAHGLADLDALHARSVADPAWFWDAIVRHLGIEFHRPYDAVLDLADGLPWARWFTGGQLNLAHNCVDRHAAAPERAGRDAIRWEDEAGRARRLTYAELASLVARCAAGLQARRVRAGDRVGLVMPVVPEAIAAWYAIVRLGAVVVPMFSGYGAPAIATRLRDAGAVAVVAGATLTRRGRALPLLQTVLEACATAPSVRFVAVWDEHGAGEAGGGPGPETVAWDDLVAGGADAAPAAMVPSEHPLMLCYTSGTTGRPKGALHVHAGFLVKTAQEVFFQADVQNGDAVFWLSDMGWIMGPWAMVGAHAAGATLVLYDGAPDHPGPGRLWELAERQQVTFLGLSPSLARALMAHGATPARAHDLSRLRLFGSGGEPWTRAAYDWLAHDVGEGRRPVINLSGGTEVAASFLSCDIAAPIKPCSLGRPALGMAVDVLDDDARPLRGAIGELVCRAPWPSMTRGIWGDRDRYLETYWSRWPDVWVHGDWASVDEDGAWYLHGRSDDTLNVAGKRISSAEYEAPLLAHPAVREACAVGVPHELKGETAWCFVVVADGTPANDGLRAELAAVVEREIGRAFRPGRVAFVTALPKTRSGKTMRRAVRAIATGGDPGDISVLEDVAALDAVRRAA
jgi:acetyl-CoA synthetase